jgi:hypothetical protein
MTNSIQNLARQLQDTVSSILGLNISISVNFDKGLANKQSILDITAYYVVPGFEIDVFHFIFHLYEAKSFPHPYIKDFNCLMVDLAIIQYESHKNKGVGKLIYKFAIQFASTMWPDSKFMFVPALYSDTGSTSESAIHLWKSLSKEYKVQSNINPYPLLIESASLLSK